LQKKGYKTLLITTDPAPNLSDIFSQQIGHKITAINNVENLFAIEINPDTASEEYRERIIAPMRKLLDEKNIQVIKEQLNSPKSMKKTGRKIEEILQCGNEWHSVYNPNVVMRG